LPVLIVVAPVGLVLSRPPASNWMSGAVPTEHATSNASPRAASTQLAQWAAAIRTGDPERQGQLRESVYPGAKLAPRSMVNSTSISPRE
jgi:hypothetical protein